MKNFLPCMAFMASSAISLMYAETKEWSLTQTIHIPVHVSTVDNLRPRTVVLPTKVREVPQFWTDDQMVVELMGNALVIQLRRSDFSTTMQVFDETGRVYLLRVESVKSGHVVDDMLVVNDSSLSPNTQTSMLTDSDGAVTEMMAAMIGGAHPHIRASVTSRVDNGEVKQGRVIFQDDTLDITLVRVWSGHVTGRLRGYECIMTWKGSQAVRVNEERLWFPGALAVWASDQVMSDQNNPSVTVQPRSSIRLCYVAE
jgi:hypothetical protein